MSTDQNKTEAELREELNDLLLETKEINTNISKISEETSNSLDGLEKDIDDTIKNLKSDYLELDNAEKETGKEMERLIIEQAEEISKDEDN